MNVLLIQLGLTALKAILESFTKAQAPQEVIDGITAAIVATENHLNDLMSKADWEAQRG